MKPADILMQRLYNQQIARPSFTRPEEVVHWLQTTFLMPDYDEYGMSYKDRSALVPEGGATAWDRYIVVDGKLCGGWRKLEGSALETELFTDLPKNKMAEVKKAVEKYLLFLG